MLNAFENPSGGTPKRALRSIYWPATIFRVPSHGTPEKTTGTRSLPERLRPLPSGSPAASQPGIHKGKVKNMSLREGCSGDSSFILSNRPPGTREA